MEKYVQGVNISVSLDELRSVEIYVVGEVNRPGLHLVPPFSAVIGGLIAGDGVNVELEDLWKKQLERVEQNDSGKCRDKKASLRSQADAGQVKCMLKRRHGEQSK